MQTFADALRTKDFSLSAEIYLRPETDAASIREQAQAVAAHVDAVLVTDNQYGQVHLSPVAVAGILLQAGVDPVMQLTSRNRNRIALLSDLLGASAIGVTSLLLVAGERAPKSMQPRPKPVLDLSATDLIRTATTINADERLRDRPKFTIGGIVTPVGPKPNWQPKKMLEKIDAGAHFLQTHLCMDLKLLRQYMQHLIDRKLLHRASVIGAVAVLESAEDAQWLRDNRPNVMLPTALLERLQNASDPRDEGIRICAETLREMAKIPGMSGACVMASRDLTTIGEAIRQAGLRD